VTLLGITVVGLFVARDRWVLRRLRPARAHRGTVISPPRPPAPGPRAGGVARVK
jgi:hypothetical protein